jgi:hypothetical protein
MLNLTVLPHPPFPSPFRGGQVDKKLNHRLESLKPVAGIWHADPLKVTVLRTAFSTCPPMNPQAGEGPGVGVSSEFNLFKQCRALVLNMNPSQKTR